VTWLVVLAAVSGGAAAFAVQRAPAVLDRIAPPPRQPAGRGRPSVGSMAAATVLIAAGALTVALQSPVLALGGLVAAVAVVRYHRHRTRRQLVAARRGAVLELCAGLAGELRAGRMPRDALIRAASGAGHVGALCPAAVAAARSGGDVPAALVSAATEGAGALRWLAACWQVAEEQGAGMAAAAERLAEHGRADEALRQEVSAQLAGPRATAALLAVLPGVGVLMGTGLGAAPLDVLLRTPWGLGCLGVGGVLAYAGVAWTERIARVAEEIA
jgi:tight adherence protein B